MGSKCEGRRGSSFAGRPLSDRIFGLFELRAVCLSYTLVLLLLGANPYCTVKQYPPKYCTGPEQQHALACHQQLGACADWKALFTKLTPSADSSRPPGGQGSKFGGLGLSAAGGGRRRQELCLEEGSRRGPCPMQQSKSRRAARLPDQKEGRDSPHRRLPLHPPGLLLALLSDPLISNQKFSSDSFPPPPARTPPLTSPTNMHRKCHPLAPGPHEGGQSLALTLYNRHPAPLWRSSDAFPLVSS